MNCVIHLYLFVKQLPEGLLKPLVGHSKDMDTYGNILA
jgi:hypothetical protein